MIQLPMMGGNTSTLQDSTGPTPLALEHEGEPKVPPSCLHASLTLDLAVLGQRNPVGGEVDLLDELVLDDLGGIMCGDGVDIKRE